jgi:hypothetical protein
MAITTTPNPPAPATRRVVMGLKDAADIDEPDLPSEAMPLNMGPSHPAMHGTVRMVLEVEGEKILSADVQVGYLHRCFEKESEYATYTQIFPTPTASTTSRRCSTTSATRWRWRSCSASRSCCPSARSSSA